MTLARAAPRYFATAMTQHPLRGPATFDGDYQECPRNNDQLSEITIRGGPAVTLPMIDAMG